MSFSFVKVTLSNFGPFESVTIPLNNPGLTLVEGVVKGCPGFESNGAGKSFIVESVPYALYGRCLRPKYTGDKVIRRGTSSAKVELLLDIDGHDVWVTRYRRDPQKDNRVEILMDGADISPGTTPEADAMIVRMLGGMDFKSFTNSIAFGARDDVTSFFSATDGERKEILERLLGLEVFGRAEEIARARLTTARESLSQASSVRDQAAATLAALRQSMDAAEEESISVEDAEFGMRVAAMKHRHANRMVCSAEEDVTLALEHVKRVRSSLEMSESLYRKARATYDAADQAWRSKEATLVAEMNAENAAGEAAKKRKETFAKLSATTCPTCKQVIGQDHCSVIISGFDDIIGTHFHRATAINMELDMWRKEPRPTPPVEIDRRSLEDANRELADARTNLAGWRAVAEGRAETLAAATQRAEEVRALQERSRKAVDDAEHAVALATSDVEAKALHEARCQFWVAGFGNQGIKSFLIESELAEINRRCGAYVSRLMGRGAKVWMTATRALKSGKGSKEEIVVHADIPGKAEDYYGGSKGQKRRMDLCVLLALRDLVASRNANGCNQLFVDEVFDGVDGSGCDAVVDLLRDMLTTGPVILVTHNPGLRKVADTLAVVTHHGAHATVALTRP